jgi:ABC-type branched-subunit amino acid transport system substrate-binding protein
VFSRQRILRAVTLVAVLAIAASGCGTKDDRQGSAASKPGESGGNLLLKPDGGEQPPASGDVTPATPTDTGTPAAAAPATEGAAAGAAPTAGAGPAPAKPSASPAGKSAAGAAAAPADKSAPAAKPGGAAANPGKASGAPAAPGTPATPGNPATPGKTVTSKGQGITDTTIKIGGTFPMSGITASFGQEGSGGVDAYIKLVNSRGGIAGRKVEYISYDDAFDPAQTLANVKRLWEKDKVAMIFAFLVDSPNEYVTQNNIPFFTFGGNVRAFSSKYPTIFPAGSAFIGWNAQLAQGVTRHFNFRPKKVAVLTDTEALNTHETAKWITDYWKAAGAEEIFIDPLNLSQGDCSSLVLKYRQAGVEFWDFQSFAFLLCVAAEDRLGWKPKMQGGPVASMGPISSQAGPSMEGVIAGSPGDLPDGRPRFNGPQAGHREYLDALRKFQPRLANIDDANSPATVAMYMSAVYAMTALQGAADSYGELSQEALYRWIYEKGFNVDVKIGPPIIGYKKGCKLGNEATWYGTWKWDAQRQKVINNGPVTPQQISPTFWTKDPCFLTGIADELVLGKGYAVARANAAHWRRGRHVPLSATASML